MRPIVLAALAVVLLVTVAAPAQAASPKAPKGFIGMMADGPVFSSPKRFDREAKLMAQSGVQTVRVAFYWKFIQPYASAAQVPASERRAFASGGNGVPTNFVSTDLLVRALAKYGITALPIVVRAPDWAAAPETLGGENPEPRSPQEYAAFVRTLVQRYGRGGAFWKANRKVRKTPIRDWQIWNEPNIRQYWRDPFGPGYVALLQASYAAIKGADRGARVVAAAMTNNSWEAMKELYDAGGKPYFDVAAINPYSENVANLLQNLQLNREVMTSYGDTRKPLWVTEVGWPAAVGRAQVSYGLEKTDAGQASITREALGALVQNRRSLGIGRLYWYTWMSTFSDVYNPFSFAGLRRATGSRAVDQPALSAFRRTALQLEGCNPRKAKRSATRC